MKKIAIVGLLIIFVWILSGCQETLDENTVILPDLAHQTESDIKSTLEALDLDVQFIQYYYVNKDQSREFINYGFSRKAGDVVSKGAYITVIISSDLNERYDYDGPYLNNDFFDFPFYEYDNDEGRYRGGGGVFEVTLQRCIDGDTTVFYYPEEIYSKITSNTPSTRYLNLDTPETFPEVEPWGLEASDYVCNLLETADTIYLQTDPGDFLTGNYGRLLAWIWLDLPGVDDLQLLNYMIVREGYARVAFLFGAGSTDITVYDELTYTEWMQKAEILADSENKGIHQ